MRTMNALISRNAKLFFRDRGMFMTSLITPIILIVLYTTFLAGIYRDSFVDNIPQAFALKESLINGAVAAQLSAALLAVSCITVTFCVNLTMVQDKITGALKDFNVSPVKTQTVYLSYFFSTVINSLIVNFLALVLCFIYMNVNGWYMSASDVGCVIIDIILLVLFGAALSNIICIPLKTQGQMSAVGTIISAGYGFICGAYMPISSFGTGLQKALSFLPGTYGTSMLKNHMLGGVFKEMSDLGLPRELVDGIADSLDCRPVFQGHAVSVSEMVLIMFISAAALCAVYIIISKFIKNRE